MSDTQHPVKPVPDGVSQVMPRLFCRDAGAEVEFCTAVFGAVELNIRRLPDGGGAHALLGIGSAHVMIESVWPGVATRPPELDGSSPVVIFVYLPDVDAAVARAADRGSRILMPAANQFWGDRVAWIMDPSGHVWTLATRIEETTEDERRARLARLYGSGETP